QAGTVHGHVRIEGTPVAGSSPLNFSDIRVHVVPAENSPMFGPTPFAPVKSDGTFTWENVTPAKYHLVLLNPPGAYLKSVRFGQQEIQGNELDLSQSASGDLELVFRYGPAELDGVLQAADDTSSNGAPSANTRSGSLVLVPEGSADSVDWQFATASQSGTFTVKPLRPGRYRIYAFEQVDMAQLQNPEVLKALENRGTDVELNENEKKQIQLTPISADELQQVFAKLGIDSTQ
ncbi:MAG: hypothetical protein JO211_13140, partial [Acidobacteriaceae bacterium]|nr:hypothetical protein [Acidobacteriaceae bacterium]